jgi:tryptophanyl-tRNA synthetase
MSKSEENPLGKIELRDTNEEIQLKIRKAVTDSNPEVISLIQISYDENERPGLANLFRIHSELTGVPLNKIVEAYSGHSITKFKEELIEALVAEISPIRRAMAELTSDKSRIKHALELGKQRATEASKENMLQIKQSLGMLA